MSSPCPTIYWHRQHAPLCVVLYAVSVLMIAGAWSLRHEPPAGSVMFFSGLLMVALAASLHHLTVSDEGDRLTVSFGPLPVFRRTVVYDDIVDVEVGRTTLIEGWGIHKSLRGGWVWNIWGRDCVVVRLRGGTLRIGTDDAENLSRFLKSRIVEPP